MPQYAKARKYQGKHTCDIEACDRESQIAGLCHPCYAADLYWAKKTVTQRRSRVKQLEVFSSRMEAFAPTLRSVK